MTQLETAFYSIGLVFFFFAALVLLVVLIDFVGLWALNLAGNLYKHLWNNFDYLRNKEDFEEWKKENQKPPEVSELNRAGNDSMPKSLEKFEYEYEIIDQGNGEWYHGGKDPLAHKWDFQGNKATCRVCKKVVEYKEFK
jgi:hypothetical protein